MNTLTSDQFNQLLIARLNETQASIPVKLKLTWDFGDYSHFNKPRGYAVTFIEEKHGQRTKAGKRAVQLHMRFSEKMLKSNPDRVDAIIRHEIGHAVDALLTDRQVQELALRNMHMLNPLSLYRFEVPGPELAELRADAIAEYLWKEPIRYDKDEVQSLTEGKIGRPKHLGF